MESAAAEERDAAIMEGRIDSNGIPLISVIADGCWSKRSYKNNYSALSGAAAIIGQKFGKVLFMAVRNKYCCICARADKIKITAKPHKCFKNFSGSSSSMESDILVEGFKASLDMHNVIYSTIISDGDSSTYAKILQVRPYPHHTVEKVECRNHILRNLCNKLRALTTDTRHPLKLRKLFSSEKILSIRKSVSSAVKYNKSLNLDLSKRIENLHRGIINSPQHVFGSHDKCRNYFCLGNKVGEINHVPELSKNILWDKK